MYVVLVHFTVKPESADAFRELVIQQAKNSITNEAACRRFDVSFDPDNLASGLLYEVYDDRAAFEAHCQADYFAAFGRAVADMVLEKQLTCWDLVSANS